MMIFTATTFAFFRGLKNSFYADVGIIDKSGKIVLKKCGARVKFCPDPELPAVYKHYLYFPPLSCEMIRAIASERIRAATGNNNNLSTDEHKCSQII